MRCVVPAALSLLLSHGSVFATTASVSAPDSGLTVRVDAANGEYQLASEKPAWTFAGHLDAPLNHVTTSRGRNDIGEYRQVAFQWQAGALPLSGSIRIYCAKSLAQFSQTCATASVSTPPPFPAFTKVPGGLHVFSFGNHEFAPPDFQASNISTPWLLFDDDADAMVISPASHFMVASMLGDGQTEIASGFNPRLRNLPAGFTQQTLLAFGRGINNAWDTWGHALQDFELVKRPGSNRDDILKYLGYWTDNGAAYYYNYDAQKGYAGTLQSLVEYYRRQQIPVRYLQLDSWWYYKTTTNADGTPGAEKKAPKLPAGEWNRNGGLLEYKAHPNLFPNGLDSFQKAIGLPLIAHNRWIDPASPYHSRYHISGLAAVDPKWWDDIADYLKTSGIVTYEQDWLDRIYKYSPEFSSDPFIGANFLDDMASACNHHRITLQYCMPLPCYFLQGSRYPNLTSIRVSGDRFTTNKWNNFFYTSRLADSLGIWPWTDVFMSAETDNLLLSTLSAGPVGIGDAIGTENKTNLFKAVRADGVIVKPDAPIVPLDRCYIADAEHKPSPLVASTDTDHDGIKTEYVFAFNRPNRPPGQIQFTPAELGLNGPVYVYDYFSGDGEQLNNNEVYSRALGKMTSAFFVVAPVGKSGIAFLGDKDKFVGTSKERITTLDDEPGRLTVGVKLAANETSVALHGYATTAPRAMVAGEEDAVEYNSITHYFSVQINADTNTPMDGSGADPVRLVTVALEMQPK